MTDEEREKLRGLAKNWKKTGEFLENLRREDIRKTITSKVLPVFDDVLESALYLGKPRQTSGFVEMYKILEKSRCKN
jgi:hypothetical protein